MHIYSFKIPTFLKSRDAFPLYTEIKHVSHTFSQPLLATATTSPFQCRTFRKLEVLGSPFSGSIQIFPVLFFLSILCLFPENRNLFRIECRSSSLDPQKVQNSKENSVPVRHHLITFREAFTTPFSLDSISEFSCIGILKCEPKWCNCYFISCSTEKFRELLDVFKSCLLMFQCDVNSVIGLYLKYAMGHFK